MSSQDDLTQSSTSIVYSSSTSVSITTSNASRDDLQNEAYTNRQSDRSSNSKNLLDDSIEEEGLPSALVAYPVNYNDVVSPSNPQYSEDYSYDEDEEIQPDMAQQSRHISFSKETTFKSSSCVSVAGNHSPPSPSDQSWKDTSFEGSSSSGSGLTSGSESEDNFSGQEDYDEGGRTQYFGGESPIPGGARQGGGSPRAYKLGGSSESSPQSGQGSSAQLSTLGDITPSEEQFISNYYAEKYMGGGTRLQGSGGNNTDPNRVWYNGNETMESQDPRNASHGNQQRAPGKNSDDGSTYSISIESVTSVEWSGSSIGDEPDANDYQTTSSPEAPNQPQSTPRTSPKGQCPGGCPSPSRSSPKLQSKTASPQRTQTPEESEGLMYQTNVTIELSTSSIEFDPDEDYYQNLSSSPEALNQRQSTPRTSPKGQCPGGCPSPSRSSAKPKSRTPSPQQYQTPEQLEGQMWHKMRMNPPPVLPDMHRTPSPKGSPYDRNRSGSGDKSTFRSELKGLMTEVEQLLNSEVLKMTGKSPGNSGRKGSSPRGTSKSPGSTGKKGSSPCGICKSPASSERKGSRRSKSASPGRSQSRSPAGRRSPSAGGLASGVSGSGEGEDLLDNSLQDAIECMQQLLQIEEPGSAAYNAIADGLQQLEGVVENSNQQGGSNQMSSDSWAPGNMTNSMTSADMDVITPGSAQAPPRVNTMPEQKQRTKKIVTIRQEMEMLKQTNPPKMRSFTELQPPARSRPPVKSQVPRCAQPQRKSQARKPQPAQVAVPSTGRSLQRSPVQPSNASGAGQTTTRYEKTTSLRSSPSASCGGRREPSPGRMSGTCQEMPAEANSSFKRARQDYYQMNPDVDGKRPQKGPRQFSEQYPRPDIDYDYRKGPDYSEYFENSNPPSASFVEGRAAEDRAQIEKKLAIHAGESTPKPRTGSRARQRGPRQSRIPEPQFKTTKRTDAQRLPAHLWEALNVTSATNLTYVIPDSGSGSGSRSGTAPVSGREPRTPSPGIPQKVKKARHGIAWDIELSSPGPDGSPQEIHKSGFIPDNRTAQAGRNAEAWEIPLTPPQQRGKKGHQLGSNAERGFNRNTTPANMTSKYQTPKQPSADPCDHFRRMLEKIPIGTKKYADAIELLADCIARNEGRSTQPTSYLSTPSSMSTVSSVSTPSTPRSGASSASPPWRYSTPRPYEPQTEPHSLSYDRRLEAPESSWYYDGKPTPTSETPLEEATYRQRGHTPQQYSTQRRFPPRPQVYGTSRLSESSTQLNAARQLISQFKEAGRMDSLVHLVDDLSKILK